MIEQLKEGLITFARVWGFCYPSKVLIVMDPTTGKKKMIEKFKATLGIKRKYSKGQQQVIDTANAKNEKDKNNKVDAAKPTNSTKANGPASAGANSSKVGMPTNSKANGAKASQKALDAGEDELKDLQGEIDVEKGMSTVTDLKTFEEYVIAGKVETFFRSRKPVEVFPMVVLAVFLPILVITEVWQIALIYNLHFDEVMLAAAVTAFITLTVHNARYAYGSSVDALYCTKKTVAGGVPIYIPNMIEFLNFKQSRNQDLRDDLLAASYAEVKPLKMENAKLMATLEHVYKSLDNAKAQGKREGLTFGLGKVHMIAPYWAIILIFAIGIIFGWILSGGVTIFPPNNSTLVNGSGPITANPLG